MSDIVNKFTRFQQEHARLHDPALLRGAVELVPVDLSRFATPSGPDRAKKKKKRHGAAAAWTRAKFEPSPSEQPPIDARLLPEDFLRRVSAKTHGEQPGVSKDNRTPDQPMPQGEPQIGVEPQNVTLALMLFQEMEFVVDAPAAQQVELVWRESRANGMPSETTTPCPGQESTELTTSTSRPSELQRVVMEHSRADRFVTQIGIADGAYLLGIVVDGFMRPDPRFSQHLLLNGEGLFTLQTFNRHTQKLQLTNRGKVNERVRLEASAPWLTVDDALDFSKQSSAELRVGLDPRLMQAGLNEALLHIMVEREAQTTSVAGIVHFSVDAQAGGAIPEISLAPHELGEIRQGIDERQLQVRVVARGRGRLTGMINLPHSGELADFCLNADDSESASFSHTFNIESASVPQPPPHRLDAVLNVMLVTDSFLANYRLWRGEIPYRLIHLKKSLPALSFGTVRTGDTRAMRLDVSRSDKQPVELTVILPSGVASYLEAYQARPDAYVFRFDPGKLPPGTSVSETVVLIDRNSGLRDQVKVLANVTHGSGGLARAEVGSGRS